MKVKKTLIRIQRDYSPSSVKAVVVTYQDSVHNHKDRPRTYAEVKPEMNPVEYTIKGYTYASIPDKVILDKLGYCDPNGNYTVLHLENGEDKIFADDYSQVFILAL